MELKLERHLVLELSRANLLDRSRADKPVASIKMLGVRVDVGHPQKHLVIAGSPGPADHVNHESLTDALAAKTRIDLHPRHRCRGRRVSVAPAHSSVNLAVLMRHVALAFDER